MKSNLCDDDVVEEVLVDPPAIKGMDIFMETNCGICDNTALYRCKGCYFEMCFPCVEKLMSKTRIMSADDQLFEGEISVRNESACPVCTKPIDVFPREFAGSMCKPLDNPNVSLKQCPDCSQWIQVVHAFEYDEKRKQQRLNRAFLRHECPMKPLNFPCPMFRVERCRDKTHRGCMLLQRLLSQKSSAEDVEINLTSQIDELQREINRLQDNFDSIL